jgi:putative PIN family toxin of toxin-antitoxin system
MRATWVLDTNVIVSGILTPYGHPGRLIDAVLEGTLRLTVDDRILVEYRQVLSRPKFCIAAERLEALMALFTRQDLIVPEPLMVDLPDPDDLPFLETARFATDRVLVTGNIRHYPGARHNGIIILTPAQAWLRLVEV